MSPRRRVRSVSAACSTRPNSGLYRLLFAYFQASLAVLNVAGLPCPCPWDLGFGSCRLSAARVGRDRQDTGSCRVLDWCDDHQYVSAMTAVYHLEFGSSVDLDLVPSPQRNRFQWTSRGHRGY